MSDDGPVSADYTKFNDSALIAMRGQVRDQLRLEPANMADLMRTHHLLSAEVVRRTIALRKQAERNKKMINTPKMIPPHYDAARLLAIEVLLAEPELLADDVLESCLYLLRDRLRGKGDKASEPPG